MGIEYRDVEMLLEHISEPVLISILEKRPSYAFSNYLVKERTTSYNVLRKLADSQYPAVRLMAEVRTAGARNTLSLQIAQMGRHCPDIVIDERASWDALWTLTSCDNYSLAYGAQKEIERRGLLGLLGEI